MELGIKGKNVLVTGGSHGIGEAIALFFAKEGCNVSICARNKDRVDRVVEEIKTKNVSALGITADVLILSDIERVVKTIIGQWGTIHILVNNVGGGGRWGKEIAEETEDQVWIDVYSKNALAAAKFTKLVIPHMKKEKWGRVVTISSIFGREGGARPWYSMAKAAEISLMKSLAMKHDLARYGITFNTIAPGAILIPDTGWNKERKENPEEFKKQVEDILPLGRLGTPEEVAAVVVFICSEQASLINGATIPVDGSEGKSL